MRNKMAGSLKVETFLSDFYWHFLFMSHLFSTNEPTWRCQQNPFIGALGIQEPVILGEPQI